MQEENCGAVFEKTELDSMDLFLQSLRDNRNLHNTMANNSLNASRKYTFLNAREYVI